MLCQVGEEFCYCSGQGGDLTWTCIDGGGFGMGGAGGGGRFGGFGMGGAAGGNGTAGGGGRFGGFGMGGGM
jgi:hypothetical protein